MAAERALRPAFEEGQGQYSPLAIILSGRSRLILPLGQAPKRLPRQAFFALAQGQRTILAIPSQMAPRIAEQSQTAQKQANHQERPAESAKSSVAALAQPGKAGGQQ